MLAHVAAPIGAAHGAAPAPPDDLGVLATWTFDPLVVGGLLAALVGYLAAVARVDRRHPRTRVPRLRVAAWLAGLAVSFVALASAIDVYATSLFSLHMVQHLLLTMVAAPLFALGAPITLLLRVASPRVRRKYILPVLHSRPLRVLAFPVVTWLLFTGVMWASHFSPLFDAALDERLIHIVEHALYLSAAMFFWWPVVGADPSPWRMAHPARIAYLFLGMPQNTFLGLAIISAPGVLYRHYAELERPWGPTALEDQQLAGGIMWAGGDILFIASLLFAILAWFRAEEAKGARLDEQLERRRRREEAAKAAEGG